MGEDALGAHGETEGCVLDEGTGDPRGLFAVDLYGAVGLGGDGDAAGCCSCCGGQACEQGEEADAGGDGCCCGDESDVEFGVVPLCVPAWVEVAAIVGHVGDDEDAWFAQVERGLGVELDAGVGEAWMKDLAEDRADVGAVATEGARLFEAVDDRSVHAQRGHDEERVAVAEGEVDAERWCVAFEVFDECGGAAGHPERVADQVGGACSAVIEGDLGVSEESEEVVHGAVAADDDEAVAVGDLTGRDCPPAVNRHGIDGVTAGGGDAGDGVAELAGLTSA